ncbi:hypothetical protein G6F59_014100 [Rhizopus arrhizus]|nr:hypothetical protein G6F59_014100 [Rhizopus arrhizus]
MERNDGYWGDKPAWPAVTLVPVPAAGPRLPGLLAGDFALLANPAARDVKRISQTPGYGYVITPSVRVVYFQFDVARSPSPTVKAADGKNPLQDVRVRRAISMAIDRKTITARIMDGMATPAYQFMPDGMFGALPKAPEIKYDPEGAKKLLAEAGFSDGFKLTMHVPNDRYPQGPETAQAVAQFWTRIGVKTQVEVVPWAVYSGRANKNEFAVSMLAWGNGTGEASYALVNILAT